MLIKKLLTVLFTTLLSITAIAGQTAKMSQKELLSLLATPNQSTFVVLDVRTAQEFAAGHIKGAINISHNTISDNLSLLESYKNKTVIVHCHSGKRAVSAENTLKKNGFSHLRHLDGDMSAWVQANLPLEK